jgi:hypothetical protein
MKVGMLWFDNDKARTLEEKVERAADYYKQKYGASPSVCYVHPTTLEEVDFKANGVELRTAPTVQPNHFWIGIEEAKAKTKARRNTRTESRSGTRTRNKAKPKSNTGGRRAA